MNSCWGGTVGGVQQMGICDWFALAMWILGFLGVCLLFWGFYRSIITGGLQAASNVTGAQISFWNERKISSRIGIIGLVMLAIAILIWKFLPL